jgi:hypothetical protein
MGTGRGGRPCGSACDGRAVPADQRRGRMLRTPQPWCAQAASGAGPVGDSAVATRRLAVLRFGRTQPVSYRGSRHAVTHDVATHADKAHLQPGCVPQGATYFASWCCCGFRAPHAKASCTVPVPQTTPHAGRAMCATCHLRPARVTALLAISCRVIRACCGGAGSVPLSFCTARGGAADAATALPTVAHSDPYVQALARRAESVNH